MLKQFTKYYSKNYFWGFFCAFISVVFVLLLPQVTQLFIDSIYSFSGTQSESMSILWLSLSDFLALYNSEQIVLILCVFFIVLAILKNIASFFSTRNFFKIASNSAGDLRKECFKKLAFLDKNISLNEVYFNFTSDIDDFYRCINSYYPKIFTSVLSVVFAFISLLFISLNLAIIFAIFIPLICIVGYVYYKKHKVQNMYIDSREKRRKMFTVSEDMLENIKEIKNFGVQENVIEKYDKLIENHKESKVKSNKYTYKIDLYMNIIKAICIGLVVMLAGYVCFEGKLSVGYFVLVLSYMIYILNGTTTIMDNIFSIQLARIGIKNTQDFLEQETKITTKTLTLNDFNSLEVNNVDLELNGNFVFRNLNLKIESGEKYNIILKQGKGKSALCRTFLRFLNVSKGQILINQINYEDIDILSLRQMFSYVTQTPYIFKDSIRNNILMFDEEDKDRLIETIKICGLEKTIAKFDDKLEHQLLDNTKELTTQEKQKINLARAIYKNAPVLLIDSAFNIFTPKTSEKLLKNIMKFYQDKTIICLTAEKIRQVNFDKYIVVNKKGDKNE